MSMPVTPSPTAAALAPRPVRPPRAATPPMPELDALDQTHREVIAVLGELQTLVEHLAEAGVDARARTLAARICLFFQGTARQHHADEERLVFPALLAGPDGNLRHTVLRLQQDHGWLEEDWLELEPQLSAVASGYSWYDLDMLRAALPVFEALYREHIGLEESLIYPEARRQRAAAHAGHAAGLAAAD